MFLDLRVRNIWLLLSSVFFYIWGEGTFAIIMLCSICSNFIWGLWIEHSAKKSTKRSKKILVISILFNLIFLLYFKYCDFFLENFKYLSGVDFSLDTKNHLPLGISFFTFENISYCFDVYRKENKAQRSLSNYALFVTFFPHLIAGPIVKYHSLASQIEERVTSFERYKEGIIRFSIGLFKKMFIANNLAFIADRVFDQNQSDLSFYSAWIAILAYTLQLYFDFSGYSDMAIGLAKLFGFELMENFNYPYISTSIQDFWRRWHISLSTWFREYLYIPLGGNRGSKFATYRNLFLVFLCTGIWHGASWNFVIWGIFHGFFIILERLGLSRLLSKLPVPLTHIYTLFIVVIGWVFFRIEKNDEAISFLLKLIGIGCGTDNLIVSFMDNFHVFIFIIAIVFSTPLLKNVLTKWAKYKEMHTDFKIAFVLQFVEYSALFIFLLASMYVSFMEIATNSYNPFIYFRF